MKDGLICVAAGTPSIRVADCAHNGAEIVRLMEEAQAQGVKILVLPELCLTGYTCGDLFLQDKLLDGALEALRGVMQATQHLEVLTALGMPLRAGGKLYNCAVVIQYGQVVTVVPKTHIPNYGEFYEQRWFASGEGLFFDHSFLVRLPHLEEGWQEMYGASPLIECPDVPGLRVGIELCEDLWVSDPPSRTLAEYGATVILNLSASNEIVGKSSYRRNLVVGQSGRLCCGYVYADAGEGESTTDLVFSGHNMIAENGALLAERRFATGLTISQLDIGRLCHERGTGPAVPGNSHSGCPGAGQAAGAHPRRHRRGGPVRRAGLHPGAPHHRPGLRSSGPGQAGHSGHHHALLRHHRPYPLQCGDFGRGAGHQF